MKGHFTTREVAKILDLSEARIRSCLRAGLVIPAREGGHYRFSFQDLVLLRTTKGLLDARVPMKRIRKMVHSLKRQLAEGQQLTSLTIYADGRRVVAWDGRARWQPDSGQFLFNFGAQTIAAEVSLPTAAAEPEEPLSAEEWFDLGSELEKDSPEEAEQAYHLAIERDPSMAAAHINLGRLDHQERRYAAAEAHYRAAIRLTPGDALAHFNLGVLLDELGRADETILAYRRALACDPEFADAHYNLALLFEAKGRRPDAIRHFRAARELYGLPSHQK